MSVNLLSLNNPSSEPRVAQAVGYHISARWCCTYCAVLVGSLTKLLLCLQEPRNNKGNKASNLPIRNTLLNQLPQLKTISPALQTSIMNGIHKTLTYKHRNLHQLLHLPIGGCENGFISQNSALVVSKHL